MKKQERTEQAVRNGHTARFPDEIPDGPEPIWCRGQHGPHDLRVEGYKVKSDGSRKCRACFREARAIKKGRGGSRGVVQAPAPGPVDADTPPRLEGYLA